MTPNLSSALPPSLATFAPTLNGRPNDQPITLDDRQRAVNNFFAANAQWRNDLLQISPRLVDDFLQTPQQYPLTTANWHSMIEGLGNWAKLNGFAYRRAALANALAQRFQQDGVVSCATHYIEHLSAILPREGRMVRAQLLELTRQLFALGCPQAKPAWSAETHARICQMLSCSDLGIYLMAHEREHYGPALELSGLTLDVPTLMQNIESLHAFEALPASLWGELRDEIARLSANSDGSEHWWPAVIRSYTSRYPLLSDDAIIDRLLQPSSHALSLWTTLLCHGQPQTANDAAYVAFKWQRLWQRTVEQVPPLEPPIVIAIFEHLPELAEPTLSPALIAFIRLCVVPALVQDTPFHALPPHLLEPFIALLTHTVSPQQRQLVIDSGFFLNTNSDIEPDANLISLSQDFKKTYFTMFSNGQKKHLEYLSRFAQLPRQQRAACLKGVFQSKAKIQRQHPCTKVQKNGMYQLLDAWQKLNIHINGEAARYIAMQLDLQLNPYTSEIDSVIQKFWRTILLPALIGDPSSKAEDHWAILLAQSSLAHQSEENRRLYACLLAQAHASGLRHTTS